MKKLSYLSILLIFILLMPAAAGATLIGLELGLPDITSNSTGTYNYYSGVDLFTSSAQALNITFDGTTSIPITSGSYSVQFHVDNSGNFVSGVSGYDLTISGTFTYNNVVYSGVLIAGEVTNFGWQDIPGPYALFDFTFDFKEGALADLYGASGNKGGDIFYAEKSNFAGNWDVSHSGTKVKHDTAPVPEPATVFLLGLGFLGIMIFTKRKFEKQKSRPITLEIP